MRTRRLTNWSEEGRFASSNEVSVEQVTLRTPSPVSVMSFNPTMGKAWKLATVTSS